MKCDFCEKKASVFLTQIDDGKTRKMSLCHDCARERGVTDTGSFSVSEVFEKFADAAHTLEEILPGDTGRMVCPTCGFSGEDLRKTGRLGCADCYGVFRETLLTSLPEMHKGGTAHKGRVPPGFLAQRLEADLTQFEQLLAQAVASESFEDAARHRDRIQEIKRQLSDVNSLLD